MPARTFASFVFGLVAFFSLVQISGWFPAPSILTGFLIEVGLFITACLLSCALAPEHPFCAATLGVSGVIAGVVLDIIIHPTINGFERNLFPLEIAFHTIIAVPIFFLAALAWRNRFSFSRRGEKNA